MSRQMRIPFGIDPTGAIASTTNPDEMDRMNVITLVGTEPGERAMRPAYGVSTRGALFEAGDDILAQELTGEVRRAFDTYAPEIDLVGVTVDYDDTNGHIAEGRVNVNISYAPGGGRLNTGVSTVTTSVDVGS